MSPRESGGPDSSRDRFAEVVTLHRLDRDQTATMTAVLLASSLPVPRDLVDAVLDRSDGIPLHVEELLALSAAGGRVFPDLGQTVSRSGDVPESVEDVILARLAARSPEAVAVARAGAVIGRSFELDFLAEVMDRPLGGLTDPIAELGDHFILLPARMPGRYGFRHALICDSIYARIPEPERRRLHARTADAARVRSDIGGGPFLAMQLERSGRTDEAFVAARSAALDASDLSSHHDARALYEMALRSAPADLPPGELGALYEAYAIAAAAVDDNVAADGGVRAGSERPTSMAVSRSRRPRSRLRTSRSVTCWATISPRGPSVWRPRSGSSRSSGAAPIRRDSGPSARPGPACSRRCRPRTCSTAGSTSPSPTGP